MRVDNIPGSYDRLEEEGIELLKSIDYELGEALEDYVKELLANIHQRDFYIRSLEDKLSKYPCVLRSYVNSEGKPDVVTTPLQMVMDEVRKPWDVEPKTWEDRRYIDWSKHNQ